MFVSSRLLGVFIRAYGRQGSCGLKRYIYFLNHLITIGLRVIVIGLGKVLCHILHEFNKIFTFYHLSFALKLFQCVFLMVLLYRKKPVW